MPNAAEVRPTEPRTLHFSLPDVDPSEELTLHVALRRHRVRVHDRDSRAAAREKLRFLRGVPDEHITHYIDVPLPLDAVAMIEVTKPVMVDGQEAEHTVHLAIHVPSEGHEAAIRRIRAENDGPLWALHPKLDALREAGAEGFDDPLFAAGLIDWQDPTEIANSLLFQHPDLLNLSVDGGGEVPAYILHKCVTVANERVKSLVTAIKLAGATWMKTEPAFGPDKQPLIDPVSGQRVMTRILHALVRDAIGGPLGLAVKLAKNDAFLKNQQWTLQYGLTTDTYHAKASDGKVEDEPLRHSSVVRSGGGAFDWAVKNLTPGSGLSIDANVQYSAAPAQQTFTVSDMWMNTDKEQPLDAGAIEQLLAGKVTVLLTDTAHPNGVARAQLVPAAPPRDRDTVTFNAAFSGSATAQGTFRLNDLRTSLTFSVSASGLGASPGGSFVVPGTGGQPQQILRSFIFDDASRNGTLTIRCKNEWLRHLSACVQFRNDKNDVVSPKDWSHKMPSGLRKIFEQDPNTKFVELVPPVRTVFGIPVPPEPTAVSFPVPPEASKVVLSYGGLGYGGSYDPAVCPIGVAITVVAEMAVPLTLCLAGTAVTTSKTVVKLLEDKETLFAICTVAGFLVAGGTAVHIGTSQNATAAIKDVAITLGPMLLSPATALGQWMIQKVSEGAAQRAAPFLNVFTTIVSGAVTAAQLSQTIIEVLSSPWKYQLEITRTITIEVKLTPDDRSGVFPDLAVRYVVSVEYDAGATIPQQEFRISGRRQDPIIVTFSQAPAGGRVKAYVVFYADNGWQAGQGFSTWYDAKGSDGSVLKMHVDVETNKVPLTIDSVYRHKAKIGFNPILQKHQWIDTAEPPDKTRVSPAPDPKKVIRRWVSIDTAMEPGQMAYVWSAEGLHVPADRKGGPPVDTPLYTLQNLSTLQRPFEGDAVPPVGFTMTPGVVYDPASPKDGSGRNFFVDSSRGEFDLSRPGSGLHLRKVILQRDGKPDFDVQTNRSWGCFPVAVDRYIFHPQGVVIGISFRYHKIYLLRPIEAPVEDHKAPHADLASGEGFREGLINGPRAIATGLDGRVLILEAVNGRIQSFDIHGNPVPYFGPEGDKPYMQLRERERSQYLDLAVEAKGYLYVLRYRDDESKPENYLVDIHEPNGEWLVSTPRFAADKLAVDLFRNLFALNYETISGKDQRPEPSVSLWTPPPPK